MDKYSVIDLFAGAGGLSLGFEQTQKYEIKVAFENNPKMQETYKRNHQNVKLFSDVCVADYKKLEKEYGKFDVVIGGPPCQGFSNANRQKNHAISKNNMLVKQYIRAIIELQPKAFVMENVGMLKSEVHRFYMERRDAADVRNYKIPSKLSEIHLLDDVYMFDTAATIIKDRIEIEKRIWPEATYTELNVIYKTAKNAKKLNEALEKHEKKLCKIASVLYQNPNNDPVFAASNAAFTAISDYYSSKIGTKELLEKITPGIMMQRMLSRGLEILDNDLLVQNYTTKNGLVAEVKSFAVYDYLKSILEAPQNDYVITSKVLCAADYGAPQKRMRFVVAGIKRRISPKIALPLGSFDEDEYLTVKDAIFDLEKVKAIYDIADDKGTTLPNVTEISKLGAKLRNAPKLYNHIVTKTTDVAMKRFKALEQGQNFHALKDELKTNTYTDAKRTQNTIYLRLNYNEPSGTVVNVRKSMWIHPVLDRAISVREAARLQTFPDSFVFCGTKDSQYQQVGNAVPPIMAKAIAKKIAQILSKSINSQDETENG